MKRCNLLLLVFVTFIMGQIFAQVGINTEDPKRDLHVEGYMRIAPTGVLDILDVVKSELSSSTSSEIQELILLEGVKNNYNRVLVTNGKGEVDYINLNDFNAFTGNKTIYKTYTFSIPTSSPADQYIDGTDFPLPMMTGKLKIVSSLGTRYIIIEVKKNMQQKDKHIYIGGRLLHNSGRVLLDNLEESTYYKFDEYKSIRTATGIGGSGGLTSFPHRIPITASGEFVKDYSLIMVGFSGSDQNFPPEQIYKVDITFTFTYADPNCVVNIGVITTKFL